MEKADDFVSEITILENKIIYQNEKIEAQGDYIQHLEEQVRLLKHARFGRSSEKVQNQDQLPLFDESESIDHLENEPETTEVKSHSRKKRPRKAIPDHYPREVIEYDLTDAEKICPHDGSQLNLTGSDTHDQLEFIPASIKVIQHKQLKYACPCCKTYLKKADKPKQPIEKSIATPSLLAYVATSKFCDSLPLYRLSIIFDRIGIKLDRANLANWMVKCGELIQPLINMVQDHCLSQAVIHMDETTVQVLDEPGKDPSSKSYMWLMATFGLRPAFIFNYSPSRNQMVPIDLLCGVDRGTAIMVDGYNGYSPACAKYDLIRLGCLVHARRKFTDVIKAQGKNSKTGKAHMAIGMIKQLYRIEKKIKDQSVEEKYKERQKLSKPIIDKLKNWMIKSLGQVPPKSTLGLALSYLNNQWDRIFRYIDNGAYPIDNNFAENAFRPFVVGRKNWIFSKSQAGAKSSANLYSLICTAKANGLNPYEYLIAVFRDLPNAQTVDDIEKLLPWNIDLG